MSALISLLLAMQTTPSVPSTPPAAVVVAPPVDWTALPELRFRRRWVAAPELSTFVRNEVAAGRCPKAKKANDRTVRVELAVLVAPRGQVRRIVPRAMGCPTVEQFATGLISRMARGNVDAAGLKTDTWFRTSTIFAWDA